MTQELHAKGVIWTNADGSGFEADEFKIVGQPAAIQQALTGTIPIDPPPPVATWGEEPVEGEVVDAVPSERPVEDIPTNVPTDEAVPIPKDGSIVKDRLKWLTPAVRASIYGLLVAVGAVLVALGFVTDSQVQPILDAADKVLGILVMLGGATAFAHVPTKGNP